MGYISKSLALMFLLLFIASMVALPQNVKALPEPTPNHNPALTLNVTEVTDTTVTLSWTSDQPPAGFVPFPKHPYFGNYILRMSNKTLDSHYPFARSDYEDIWTTSDSQQTTTIVTNLSSSTKYYFYILAGDYLGGAFSNIVQIQTLPSPTSSPTIAPTPIPTLPEFPTTLTVSCLVVIALGAVVFSRRKNLVGS